MFGVATRLRDHSTTKWLLVSNWQGSLAGLNLRPSSSLPRSPHGESPVQHTEPQHWQPTEATAAHSVRYGAHRMLTFVWRRLGKLLAPERYFEPSIGLLIRV